MGFSARFAVWPFASKPAPTLTELFRQARFNVGAGLLAKGPTRSLDSRRAQRRHDLLQRWRIPVDAHLQPVDLPS